MVISYQYTYLILGLTLFFVWLILYFLRKDIRKEMLIISLLFGIAGLVVESTYIIDWWKPLTITNTAVGIEDFLFGFTVGGIASVLYEEVFKRKIRMRKKENLFTKKKDLNNLLVGGLLAIIFFGSFYILHLNTLFSSILGFGIPTLIMWIRRKDLILDSIASGILLMLVSFVVYSFVNLLTPGWVYEFWHFNNVPNWVLFNVPIDDVIWYFFAGAFIGPLYEFWQEKKLINLSTKKLSKKHKKS